MADNKATNLHGKLGKPLLDQFRKRMWEIDCSSTSPILHRLASEGNEVELIHMINNGSDVNEEDADGLTALYHATDRGHANVIEILLHNGAHVNGKPSPLLVVKDLKSAQLLLLAKANLNARDEFGNSPLQTAITKGNPEIVEYFLSVGADIFCTNAKGETPLHTLCSSIMINPDNETLTRKLIEMGANVNSKDSQGRSPLHFAVENHYLWKSKTVDILIKAGASVTDVDLRGMNPIHHFIDEYRSYLEGYNEVFSEYINLLVVNDSVANSKNAIGQTILHLAILAEAPLQSLEYLVEKGCRPDTVDSLKRCLLHCIVERDLDDVVDILHFFLDKGLNVNCPDIWGQTALHHAVEKNKNKLVKALVERGADVNAKDLVDRQPLHIAAESGRDVMCDFLINMGANINALDKYQSTPLHFAAWSNKASVTHVLIEAAGCDAELRDACGQTAEEMAKFWSSLNFLQIIHEKDGKNNLESEQRNKLFTKHGGELLELKTFQDIIDSSEESLGTSGTLNEFLSCLLSTPGIGTVFGDPEAEEIRDVLDSFAANIVKRIADNHPKMRCTLYGAGSSSEGTKTKYPDEFDYVVCFDELSENVHPKYKTEDVLESLQLVSDMKENKLGDTSSSVSNYTRIVLKDRTKYEYSEFTSLQPNRISNYLMLHLFTQQLSNIVYDESFPKDERLVIKDVTIDPKLCLLWRGSRYKSLAIEVGFVPAVRLPSWPDKFRIRSPILSPDLLQLPCLAVPKMTSQEDDSLWRCSPCLVETAIMKRCLRRIRNSYIAAKSLINSASICPFVSFEDYEETKMHYKSLHDSVSSDEELEMYELVECIMPSYILKMAFFQSVEEKAVKDGVETVFDGYNQYTQRSESASDIATCEVKPDPEIVKDIFMKCDDWLSNEFVPSFFNPRQNVLGTEMLVENGVSKAQMFVKYILKLLNEKC